MWLLYRSYEEYSNRAIYANEKITASYPSEAEADVLEYRSKKEITEGLRVITIENVDCCACCAPHPERTGEIGIIKIIEAYPYKQGTRIEMLAGINALKDYVGLNKSNKYLMGVLSAPREKVKEAVDMCRQHFGAIGVRRLWHGCLRLRLDGIRLRL